MILRAGFGAAALALALWAPPARGGGVPPARFEDPARGAKLAAAFPEIEKIFAEAVEKQHIPGAAIGIVIDGELVLTKGFGVRDITTKAPVDADTVFRIASMTKSFTAVAILKLRDEGKLSLDDAVSKYVPELRGLAKATDDAPAITIRHLLSHSEGFPEDNPWGDRQLSVSDETFARRLKAGIPFSNTPGVAFEYSNTAYASWGRPANAALEALDRTGALKPRVPQPSAALLSAQAGVNKLVLEPWCDAVAGGLATDNLFLDKPKEVRKAAFAELRDRHGACRPAGPIEVETALRGAWKLACDRGVIRVEITLAPTLPPRVQHLATTSALPLSESLARAADGLTTPAAWGRCTRGEVLRGDGETTSVVRFDCERGRLDADIAFDKESGRLSSATLSPAKDENCVP